MRKRGTGRKGRGKRERGTDERGRGKTDTWTHRQRKQGRQAGKQKDIMQSIFLSGS